MEQTHTRFLRVPRKILGKQWKFEKVVLSSRWEFIRENACSIYDFSQQFSTMLNLAERGELLSLPDGRFRRISGHFWRKNKMENSQQLCTCITLLRPLLLHSLHDYDVKRLNARSDGLEDVNERRRFFSLFFSINLDESFSIQLPKKFIRTHWARLNNSFLREFFTAVVVKVANKLPDNRIIDIAALMTQLAI